MHIVKLILSNLVQKSEVLQGMVEDTPTHNVNAKEGDFIFTYNDYPEIHFPSILRGFGITMRQAAFVAFNVFNAEGLKVADMLLCNEYVKTAVSVWIRDNAPWDPIPAVHNEIMTDPYLYKLWASRVCDCIKARNTDAVRRLWIDTKDATDFWGVVKDYGTGEFLMDRSVRLTPKGVSRLINNCEGTLFETLLDRGLIDPTGQYNNRTYLTLAAIMNREDIVRMLLKRGADPLRMLGGVTALSCAEFQMNCNVFKTLVKHTEDLKPHKLISEMKI